VRVDSASAAVSALKEVTAALLASSVFVTFAARSFTSCKPQRAQFTSVTGTAESKQTDSVCLLYWYTSTHTDAAHLRRDLLLEAPLLLVVVLRQLRQPFVQRFDFAAELRGQRLLRAAIGLARQRLRESSICTFCTGKQVESTKVYFCISQLGN